MESSGDTTSRMLVVDDERDILFAMHDFFQRRGFGVSCATNPGDAAEELASEDFDVVVIDLRLSHAEQEGLEVVALARQRRPDCRIVVLTAYGTEETRAEASARGADLFIDKPVRLAELATAIAELLGAQRA